VGIVAIVGHESERSQVRELLGRVGDRGAVTIAVTGPARSDKSGVLRAVAAEHEDWLVLWANCLPLGDAIAFGVVYQWFAGLARVTEDGDEPFDGPGAALRELVIRGAVDTDAAEISYAVRWAVARLAVRQRVLLIVDDLQWADAASATVIGHLVSLLSPEPIALLCGIRDDQELPGNPVVEAILHGASVVSLRRGRLTPAERRVATLAAAGLTNREIATQLFVTLKTVEFHLSRCYRKLRVTTRHGLADLLEAEPVN
jgi:DNA-binding CsgD family transcriptional regulator